MEQENYNYHKTNKTMQNINNNVGGYTTVSPPESRRLAGFPLPIKVLKVLQVL